MTSRSPGMKRFADYELIEQLQPGNHGTFYKARSRAALDLGYDVVALKILDRYATDNEFKRMAAELRVLLELNHPNLVAVIDAGHENGRLYYATRFYHEGGLPVGPADDLSKVVTMVADAADAAHALHEIGVAHRDIKPSNILMADGRGHLSDLGVANYADAHFTTTGSSPVGTLAYAEPALIRGDPPGRASDIWSLGASLYTATTGWSILGQIPDAHLAAAIEYVLGAEAQIAPDCNPVVAGIVAKATRPERADRYLTADEMAAALRAAAHELSAAGGAMIKRVDVGSPSPDPVAPLQIERPGQPAVRQGPAYEQPVLVDGVMSVAGHLNHPQGTECWVSGERRGSSGPWVAARAQRPPLGVLLVDDGRSYVVRWNTVLGRAPESHEKVLSGQAAPLALEGELTMSRAHLVIELRDWDVYVTDVSSNGSRLRSAATRAVTNLERDTPVLLRNGDELLVEGRVLTFQSHHHPAI